MKTYIVRAGNDDDDRRVPSLILMVTADLPKALGVARTAADNNDWVDVSTWDDVNEDETTPTMWWHAPPMGWQGERVAEEWFTVEHFIRHQGDE